MPSAESFGARCCATDNCTRLAPQLHIASHSVALIALCKSPMSFNPNQAAQTPYPDDDREAPAGKAG